MMEMKEQTGSRKKLLVPVVVLMLCLVALTGAAYAYSSILTNEANGVSAKTLTLDLATGSVEDDVTTEGNFVVFTDNFGYTSATKNNTIKYELQNNVVVAVYAIKVTGDAGFNKFTLSSTTENKTLEGLKPFDTLASGTLKSKTLGDLYNFTYTIGTTGTDAGASDILGATELGTQGSVNMSVGTTYYVTLTATLDGTSGVSASGTVETVADATAVNAHKASTYANAFGASTFALELTVTYVAP